MSKTHTTSQKPAPSLSPATVEASGLSTTLIKLVHADENDPNFLNMSPTESEAPVFFPESVENVNFLHLASPVVPDIVTSLSSRGHSTYSLLEDSSPSKGHHISLSK